jgi:hypothetical protein
MSIRAWLIIFDSQAQPVSQGAAPKSAGFPWFHIEVVLMGSALGIIEKWKCPDS